MKPFRIPAGNDTPEVIFNPEKDHFNISGICHPEDIKEFFIPIFNWLDEYYEEIKGQSNKKLTFNFYYVYLNSASIRHLYDLLKRLMEFKNSGIEIEIIWNYAEDDEDMMDVGVELSELKGIHLPFKYVPREV